MAFRSTCGWHGGAISSRGTAWVAAFVGSALLLSACTFGNQATFAVDSSTDAERLLDDIERYFAQLGLQPKEKVDFEYPKKRKQRSYVLGHRQFGLLGLHNAYQYVVLRLEETDRVYVDWLEISSTKRVPKPGDFDVTHAKIASDLKARFGVDMKFSFIEAK